MTKIGVASQALTSQITSQTVIGANLTLSVVRISDRFIRTLSTAKVLSSEVVTANT